MSSASKDISHSPNEILKKYWGFDQFRSLQNEIIDEVLDGKDVLALLPTGGGKSICFQVPALCRPGICIVVSPLIALMKDQVSNLKQRGIKAMAIYSGMSYREIDIALDNCIYGNFKFLYVSPERLKTELFQMRLLKMNVNLIAIDEAHCISQWGYDFRPAYTEISTFREKLPDVPLIALTATATERVVIDIQEQLMFKEQNVIRKSFYRENLRYFVNIDEDKLSKMMSIITKQNGSGIVYVRSRKLTVEYAQYISARGIKATFYHAGLSLEEREQRQSDWISEKHQVIVSTNAFGMGIDKSNVRFVINMDLPECIEAYFQEAGRGGRDEQKAYAVLLVNESDKIDLIKRTQSKYPEVDVIKRVYLLLCNHLRLANGAGEDETYPVDIGVLKASSPFSIFEITNSLGILERAGYIVVSEGFKQASRVKLELTAAQLYPFQVRYKHFDVLLKVLLRSYTGLFDTFITVDEKQIAKRTKFSIGTVKKHLHELNELKVLIYEPRTTHSAITFLQPRMDPKYIRLDAQVYQGLKNIEEQNVNAIIKYAYGTDKCRSQVLLNYFGESKAQPCGTCDICVRQKKFLETAKNTVQIQEAVISMLESGTGFAETKQIIKDISVRFSMDNVKKTVSWMIDNNILEVNDLNQIKNK
ncbi:MAG: ATP-dependent DNA helicase RecQ [Flavobacteriales bacterium]|jgi:ATP-dependent DNA helicase RecQ